MSPIGKGSPLCPLCLCGEFFYEIMSNDDVYAGGLLKRALDPATQPPEIQAFLRAELDLLHDVVSLRLRGTLCVLCALWSCPSFVDTLVRPRDGAVHSRPD